MKKALIVVLALMMTVFGVTACGDKKKPEDVLGEYSLAGINLMKEEYDTALGNYYLGDIAALDDADLKACLDELVAYYAQFKFDITGENNDFIIKSYVLDKDGTSLAIPFSQKTSVYFHNDYAPDSYYMDVTEGSMKDNFLGGNYVYSKTIIIAKKDDRFALTTNMSHSNETVKAIVKKYGYYSGDGIYAKKAE